MGWSWKGNGKVNGVDLAQMLDVSWNWNDAKSLTEWGKILVNDVNGIKNTSKRCSVFP